MTKFDSTSFKQYDEKNMANKETPLKRADAERLLKKLKNSGESVWCRERELRQAIWTFAALEPSARPSACDLLNRLSKALKKSINEFRDDIELVMDKPTEAAPVEDEWTMLQAQIPMPGALAPAAVASVMTPAVPSVIAQPTNFTKI